MLVEEVNMNEVVIKILQGSIVRIHLNW